MKKTNKIIISAILVAILILGIAYAAIQNITLNIAGTATVEPVSFNVKFTGTPSVSENTYVTAKIINDTNATINIRGLSKKGETATATYIIKNESVNLSAALSVATTNSNTDYFTIRAQLEDVILTVGEETTVLVTVELTKEINQDTQIATIGVQLKATPVDPNEEVDSDKTNDFSQTPEPTLSLVTNANIGEYIDLGNDLVGTEDTIDDWRILYVEKGEEGEEDTIYAILADYLPASKVPTGIGLKTELYDYYKYSVWSETDRDTLLNGLTHETAWNSLANGIEKATVKGAPTGEMLIKSYNAKSGENLEFDSTTTSSAITLSSTTKDYDLYVPHTDSFGNCSNYWLASTHIGHPSYVWCISYNGKVANASFGYTSLGVRPVVSLPSTTKVTKTGNVWTVNKLE